VSLFCEPPGTSLVFVSSNHILVSVTFFYALSLSLSLLLLYKDLSLFSSVVSCDLLLALLSGRHVSPTSGIIKRPIFGNHHSHLWNPPSSPIIFAIIISGHTTIFGRSYDPVVSIFSLYITSTDPPVVTSLKLGKI
jgi:hypothetical protein